MIPAGGHRPFHSPSAGYQKPDEGYHSQSEAPPKNDIDNISKILQKEINALNTLKRKAESFSKPRRVGALSVEVLDTKSLRTNYRRKQSYPRTQPYFPKPQPACVTKIRTALKVVEALKIYVDDLRLVHETPMNNSPSTPRSQQSTEEALDLSSSDNDSAPYAETVLTPLNSEELHAHLEKLSKEAFISSETKTKVRNFFAAASSSSLTSPSHEIITFKDNEFELTNDLEHMDTKARDAVISMASTQRLVGTYTQSPEPIADVMIPKIHELITEKFAHGFADGELHGLFASILQQPIYLVDKYIADVKEAAREASKIFDNWPQDELSSLDNLDLIKKYCSIIENPANASKKIQLPKEIDHYRDDNLKVVQWVTKKLAAELTVLDYTNLVFYNHIIKVLDALLDANHQLTILQRSEIRHRDNIKIFSYDGQKSIESEEGLKVLNKRLCHLEEEIQKFISALQKKLAILDYECPLDVKSINPHLQTYEKAENLCDYITDRYRSYVDKTNFYSKSEPESKDAKGSEKLKDLFDLVNVYQNSKLKKDYKQSVDYYLEQEKQFNAVSSKSSPSSSTTSSPTTISSADISQIDSAILSKERKERAAKLREYQETVLNPYAETLKNLGPLSEDQVKRILKAAYLRLYLQLSKALKEDDVQAKYTVQAAILELRVYKQWFDAQENNNKDELLKEIQDFFGKPAQDNLEEKSTSTATKAKIGLALAFAACAGACFAVSGDFSLDNPDFEMPNEFDHFAAYYGSFGSNFLLYFNSFQIIFETYLDNMKELWNNMNKDGFFISNDYRVVPVTHWQKKGDISQIIGYAVGSTILVCFGLSELLGWYTLLISPFVFLSILLVTRFSIDSRCDNLNQKLLDKVLGTEQSLGWKIWWGFLFAGVGSISSAMGYATLGKFISAFNDLIPISLIGADPLIFISTALFSIGYAILFASKIPAWIRIPLGILCICAALAILGYLAVTLGPGIFLLAAASFVAVTTTMMVFKMLSNAFIKFRENITELWKLFKHTREENPNTGAGLLIAAFVLCTLAVALNAVVFGALSILGLQDTLPMFTPDTPSAFLQPLWYLVTGFSALNGFNTSIGVQRRFVAHFGDRLAMFCDEILPEYNKMLAREYAKNKGSQTSVTAWILGAPLFLAAATVLFTVGTVVYFTCVAVQKLRGKEASAVVTPWQALKMLVSAYAQDNGWRTTAAVWLVGAPLFIVAAITIHLVGWFVYAACIKVQQLRQKDVSSVVTPVQFLDMTMKFFMQPLLRFLNSLGRNTKSNEVKMKKSGVSTSGSSASSITSSSPLLESPTTSAPSPSVSTGRSSSFRNPFKRDSAPDPQRQPPLPALSSA